jgi:hypothetical protein
MEAVQPDKRQVQSWTTISPRSCAMVGPRRRHCGSSTEIRGVFLVEIEGGRVEQSVHSAADSADASGLGSYLTFAHVEHRISLKNSGFGCLPSQRQLCGHVPVISTSKDWLHLGVERSHPSRRWSARSVLTITFKVKQSSCALTQAPVLPSDCSLVAAQHHLIPGP